MGKVKRAKILVILSIIVVLSLVGVFKWLSSSQAMSDKMSGSMEKGCLSCHEGIEDINPKMTQFFITSLGKKPGSECSVCHAGDPMAKDKDAAHKGMYVNPSDLSVIEKTCAQCHKDHVTRVEKSLMANAQGEIAGTLYARGFTKDKMSGFAMHSGPVVDDDGVVPADKGAIKRLEPIPDSDRHWSIEMLRKVCIKCHMRVDGIKMPKWYRASGCASCHMPTADDGKYKGADPTIKDKPWKSAYHKITNKIPAEQCARCHKGGNRIGVSFVSELAGHVPDIHYQKGMHCIDCHTSKEIHGDGNIYTRKWQQVRIRCDSCHGSPDSKPTMANIDGEKLPNLKEKNGKYILTSKVTGKEHTITSLNELKSRSVLPVGMAIPQHMNKMECFACHGTKNVNCYACHYKVDRTKMGKDTITGKDSPGAWTPVGADFSVKWKTPPLSIRQTGKVAPNQLGCAVHITEMDKDGKTIREYSVNHDNNGKTVDGYTAYGRVAANPHTSERRGIPTCNECHKNPAALGLGTGKPETFKTGRMLMADPDRLVDENGKQLLAFTQPDQRPLNLEEMNRIKRVGECTICHSDAKAEFWIRFKENYGWYKKNPDEHDKKMKAVTMMGGM